MPNTANVAAPIVLVSLGRSGTTLVSNIFANRQDMSSCGETVDLIFDQWNTAQRSLSHITPEIREDTLDSVDVRSGRFVQQGFLALLHDDRQFWFQKPIGVPASYQSAVFDLASWEERADNYWRVMRHAFPEARMFTVLRHPCDVVMSYKQRFDEDERSIWAKMGFLASILLHPASMVAHAVSYEDLANRNPVALRELFSYLAVPDDPIVMKAFDTVHTSIAQRASSSSSGFSWKPRWGELDGSHAEDAFVEPIRELFARFGKDMVLFDGLATSAQAASTSSTNRRENEDTSIIQRRLMEIELFVSNLDARWLDRSVRLENELNEAYLQMTAAMKLANQKLEEEYLSSNRMVQENFHQAYRQLKEELRQSYQKVESELTELTSLRTNPTVRLLKWLGVLRLADRLRNFLRA